jgi:hypothetical protein
MNTSWFIYMCACLELTTHQKSCPPYALICDAGCGNGKNLPACCYTSNSIETEALVGNKDDGELTSITPPPPRGRSKRGYGIGSDFSKELIGICNQRGLEALVADSLALP